MQGPAKAKVPQYLHLPVQVLWFDMEEIMVMTLMYIIALIFGGFTWLALVVVPFAYMQVKRRKPRGFLRHFLYQLGIFSLEGYPQPYSDRFYE